MGKVYTRFPTKTAQKLHGGATHTVYGLYKGVETPRHPPGIGRGGGEGTTDISILFSLYQTLS